VQAIRSDAGARESARKLAGGQFCVSGYAKQSGIIRAFGVTSISVKRSVKLYREKGTRGFRLNQLHY
jgi:hypothetical protein